MESICALIFTLILMFPLVIQLQMLIASPKKVCSIFHYYASNGLDEADEASDPRLLQFYPKEPAAVDSKLSSGNPRATLSLPAVPRALSITLGGEQTEPQLPEARHSSTFVNAGDVLPVVDIPRTYSSYRHKAFKECLRDYYGARYPPGEVLLNSMQLNLLDSKTHVGLSVAGFFDFVKDSEPMAKEVPMVPRRLAIEHLNPLDHFVTRQPVRPFTEDRYTETGVVRQVPSGNAPERDGDPVRDGINEREKNAINRRFPRTIEPVCKCNLYRNEGTC